MTVLADCLKAGVGLGVAVAFTSRRHEPNAAHVLFAYLALQVLTPVAILRVEGATVISVVAGLITFDLALLASTAIVIIGYRLGPWHPLAKLPGPRGAKITKLWASRVGLTGKKHLVYADLHRQHGDIVRIGPNEVSINRVDALSKVYGPPTKLWRGPLYRPLASAGKSILAQEDPIVHRRRRHLWNNALTTSALADYEPALYSHAEELIATLTKLSASSSPIDLRKMIYFFALDFAGHLAFSSASSFHFLRDRADTEGHATFLLKGAKYVQALNQVSWCYDLLAFLPKSQGVARFREWARERVKERLKAPAQTRDVFTYLHDVKDPDHPPLSNADLAADALIVITAGSDTSQFTTVMLFYHLLSHRDILQKVQTEIDGSLGPYDPSSSALPPASSLTQARLPLLHACVDETLRLFPATPVGLQRIAPAEGLVLADGTVIPAGTKVGVPGWCLHRDERNFAPRPEAFRPERWLHPEKETAFDRTAYIPFSQGYTVCPGRALALKQILLASAAILWKFHLEFADGFEPDEFQEGLFEAFVLMAGPLMVKLKPR